MKPMKSVGKQSIGNKTHCVFKTPSKIDLKTEPTSGFCSHLSEVWLSYDAEYDVCAGVTICDAYGEQELRR